MDLHEEIALIEARVARAIAEREVWRASGIQEKYLEACSMVEALGLQLDLLRHAARG